MRVDLPLDTDDEPISSITEIKECGVLVHLHSPPFDLDPRFILRQPEIRQIPPPTGKLVAFRLILILNAERIKEHRPARLKSAPKSKVVVWRFDCLDTRTIDARQSQPISRNESLLLTALQPLRRGGV